ncbi:hypothetical protein OIU84_029142 [Salix udensis]|uniref:Uncharacterized protein n=1 Tax=Salix udensis TaxID=889485 RepID=A0AAD6KA76_9ROSI|nr:hypothetical protein OIU84_029142 [Salix udensis]
MYDSSHPEDYNIFYNVYHEVLKLPVSSTPVLIEGLPFLLELQDLPSFVAVPDSYPANVKMTMSQFANLDKADRVLINTFYKLVNEEEMKAISGLESGNRTKPSQVHRTLGSTYSKASLMKVGSSEHKFQDEKISLLACLYAGGGYNVKSLPIIDNMTNNPINLLGRAY